VQLAHLDDQRPAAQRGEERAHRLHVAERGERRRQRAGRGGVGLAGDVERADGERRRLGPAAQRGLQLGGGERRGARGEHAARHGGGERLARRDRVAELWFVRGESAQPRELVAACGDEILARAPPARARQHGERDDERDRGDDGADGDGAALASRQAR